MPWTPIAAAKSTISSPLSPGLFGPITKNVLQGATRGISQRSRGRNGPELQWFTPSSTCPRHSGWLRSIADPYPAIWNGVCADVYSRPVRNSPLRTSKRSKYDVFAGSRLRRVGRLSAPIEIEFGRSPSAGYLLYQIALHSPVETEIARAMRSRARSGLERGERALGLRIVADRVGRRPLPDLTDGHEARRSGASPRGPSRDPRRGPQARRRAWRPTSRARRAPPRGSPRAAAAHAGRRQSCRECRGRPRPTAARARPRPAASRPAARPTPARQTTRRRPRRASRSAPPTTRPRPAIGAPLRPKRRSTAPRAARAPRRTPAASSRSAHRALHATSW